MNRTLLKWISFVGIVIIATLAYWYFLLTPHNNQNTGSPSSPTTSFSPFGNTPSGSSQSGSIASTSGDTGLTTPAPLVVPALRLLSATPVGGYAASTTASTTVVRWVDRGRGNILEVDEDSLDIKTLSNTLMPKMYESIWNKGLTAFIGSILGDNDATVSTLYASLVPQKTVASSGTSTPLDVGGATLTPYELRGENLPNTIVSYAVAPDKTKVFLFSIENGMGIGYVAPFNGGTATRIFSTPITQVNVEWPEKNTIAITTKGSAGQSGYLYFVSPQTGAWKKVLGPLPGLSTRVSHDARYVIASYSDGSTGVLTSIYSIETSVMNDAVIRTLADKCVWGNFYTDLVYCAVPFQPVAGTYPDDWYKGTLATVDKIWQVNATTGEVTIVSSLFDQAKTIIDAYNMQLDDKDNYLFFMNKYNLSLWSLDLVGVSS